MIEQTSRKYSTQNKLRLTQREMESDAFNAIITVTDELFRNIVMISFMMFRRNMSNKDVQTIGSA